MSGFAIFAFILTGIYIVYMSVVIMMDLFGKKSQKQDSSEEFNNSDMVDMVSGDDDSSTVVDETSDGYSVHQPGVSSVASSSDEGDDDETSDDGEPLDEQSLSDGTLEEEYPDDDDTLDSQVYFESLRDARAQMDTVVPSYQDEYGSEDFAIVQSQPLNKRSRILRHFVEP